VGYVYFDIAKFTHGRSVEAQSDVIAALNNFTVDTLTLIGHQREETVFVPTGDGMAVALLEPISFDAHLSFGVELIRVIAEANTGIRDAVRQFEIRIGINENVDNVIEDINGNRNVAGLGISMAQRIMDQADPGPDPGRSDSL